LNYRRALEGELSRTIRSLSGVQQCRVHLVTPDKSIFALQDKQSDTTAAVFLSLEKGRKLSSSEIDGIVHLVSSSVEDLSPGSITVVDNKGELLTRPNDDTMIGLSNTQMEYQNNYEKDMIARIVSILEPVVGKDRIKAKVSSQFDFTRSERTEEIYDPEKSVVRSEQKSSEKSSSGGGTAGIPGTPSNLPGGIPPQAVSSMGQSQKQDEMINYETSKTVTHVVEAPVMLKRITVAILIDGLLPSQQGSVEKPDEYIKRSESDVKYYEDIVKKTIGFTDDRGDEISVTVMPFAKAEVEEIPEAKTDYMPVVFTALKYFIPVLIVLLVIFLVIRPMMSMSTKAAPEAAAAVHGVELGEAHKPKALPSKSEVIEWAAGNPQMAAGVVKEWLEEK
ncbi:MAG: flagellar basal-body MS-ring/collar protein FliF, partial [Nitrospirota bacterium]|nr:flagellar basal-body MS-ring/collar protein FliF [Nitrospirota bacterium]